MDKSTSHKIIKDTLEEKFDKNKFLLFVKNLCNQIDESKAFQLSGAYIPDAFRGYIKSYERLGTFTDPEDKKIDVLIVYLQKEISLERARTAQRNFVARYLKDRDQKDAGLVAFVSPNSEDWRFSLIKMEYKFTEGKSGKVKVKEEFTPARRWSFLVGANENSHTAQSRLAPILQDDEHNPPLKFFEEAFNIEKVTKEFFEKYRELFLRTKETLDEVVKKDSEIRKDFTAKGVDTVDFAKKLLGQIVFLYFLQKKGWFGVERDADWGSGPKNFLRQLFDKSHSDYRNFFNDILEPLFYEALARERDHDFYSRFNCKIPFLNGGLFDPINNYDWVHTDILLPNDLFSNKRKTKEGDVGDGILDIFDRYNFTVKEDEPLEKEVAIDPETLGKVFENLLEVKDRKSKGTYYTPREIVHYMCVQSLISYLATELNGKVSKEDLERLIKYGETVGENEARVEEKGEETQTYYYKMPESVRLNAKFIDEELSNIKVCDPAIGSGAFPVGMMTEIVRARNTLSNYLKDSDRTLYNFKRDCIQNSLYGVDVDPGAVEIAKLRLWLSLVVDEDDIKQIKPLPNLDYKIMQGNSLLEEFEGVKLFNDKLIANVNLDKEKQLQSLKDKQNTLQNEYIKLHQSNQLTNTKKAEFNEALKSISNQIKRLSQLEKSSLDNLGLFDVYSSAKKKADELKRLHKEFFETTQKKKKDDLKKQIEKLEWDLIEATLKEQDKNSELKKLEEFKRANTKPFFLWKLHFYEIFQNGGFDVVIANPPYIGERKHKNVFLDIQKGNLKEYYFGRMDYFYFFFHLALNIGKEKAKIAFITTNYYPTALGARKLREDFRRRGTILALINFNELKIFASAAGQHNMITLLSKETNIEQIADIAITKAVGLSTSEVLNEILNQRHNETEYLKIGQSNLWEGEESYLRLTGSVSFVYSPTQRILAKLSDDPSKQNLGDICNTLIGLESSLDKVYVIHKDRINEIATGQIEKEYVKPFFKNSDIARYHINTKTDHYILYLHEKIKNIKSLKGIWVYLNKHKKEISSRKGANLRGAYRRGNWWVLNTPRLDMDFKDEKIVTPYRSKTTRFAFSECEWFASRDVYYITKKDPNINLKYILALLNSRLYFLWLCHKGKRKGAMLELYSKPLSEIPVKKISEHDQKSFVEIVDRILAISKSNDYLENTDKQAKVKEYECQIDQMIYKLYEFTPAEIEMVENFCK